ncbi:PSD1 and planctomycete cytochrome C domain-containing protein [Stieleria sp. TO1_6]|uniref:PSD1 and planctomycete cytochrome C domain-containing protein n=1 Tax=Stieleria tagensis TaxID=2956795 RepID=UPI00209A683E|nr:PSD1 and planctomycete cytochrome C domain-containing protein [Stieleria tagensis]MCO8125098.1 PSD1 and planctomycete cytochrome C domain-containing protein [Stieleria tagensis]
MHRHLSPILILLVLAAVVPANEPIEFNRDIRPILSDNCFFCHGFDQENRKAGLRLDTFAGATEIDSIVPGRPEESELVRRLISTDESEVMPPPETEKQLTNDQLDLIRRWIKQGAEYQQHWAWSELRRPAVPAIDGVPGTISDTSAAAQPPTAQQPTAATAIDAFLASDWQQQQAQPVDLATPRERLRRLSYDLRGLPPTPTEVARFESDPTDKAFAQQRDEWMSEVAYAEHQAVRWLDLVRWADTSGFVSDEPIASGAYRKWIIESFRRNQPFDQFSIEQLAGDLLPAPTDDQLIASGYNRIVNTNCEAGAIETEQLYKLKGEHVRAVGTVWMGMTTGCAECHDHKFDPISAKDYYSLAAFFDDLVEAGVYTPGDRREPLHYVHNESTDRQRDRDLVEKITGLQETIANKSTDDQADWEQQIREQLSDKTTRSEFVWAAAALPAPRVLEGTYSMRSIDGRRCRETVADENEFRRHHAAEFITGYVKPGAQKTDGSQDAWFVDVWIDPQHRPDMLGFQISNGRYGRLGWNTGNYETYYWGQDTTGKLANEHAWSDPDRVKRMGDLPVESGWVRLSVSLDDLLPAARGQAFESTGMAWLQSGGRIGWGDSGLTLRHDKVTALQLGETAVRKWWSKPVNRQVYERRTDFVASALRTDIAKRDPLEQSIVIDAFREQTQPEQMAELRLLESELFRIRSAAMPVLVSKQSDHPKTTRLLHRGDYQDETGPVVSAAIPEFLSAEHSPSSQPMTRLDLAQWLFSDQNPLTARVFVNRLWHQFYGRGISETLEDSGTQGDWPSNLALLDWLACEFRDSGWDRDHMVRLLTSTRAYQLSSTPSGDLQQRDPDNRWHARQGRYRLTAEQIRDSALDVAGLLKTTDQIPTHSFFPYQPDPYWTRSDKVMYGSRHMIWETSPDSKQYRRSVYTFWKRQNIHPTMLAFDAPTRQECTAQRNITNTPAQALALLNDPIFVEAARVLAMRICDSADSDDTRLTALFSLALQRQPAPAESRVLKQLLASQRTHYGNHPSQASELVSIGNAPAPSADSTTEIAAWTAVTRAVINLHEFLNRS